MDTGTATITGFLLARIAEDEAELGALAPGVRDESAGPNGVGWAEVGAISEVLMVSHARMRAACEANRQIVEEHGPWSPREGVLSCSTCSGADYGVLLGYPCMTLRALALPYADHLDYREEWRP